MAGVGGIVLDPKGNQENTFEWGLGRASNNQVETLALFQGLRILDESYIKRLIVIGDSTLVIKLMLRASSLSDGKLIRIVKRIRKEVARFKSIEYYHILRELNQKADQLANMAAQLNCGALRTKIGVSSSPIP
jgi:ribonuclease HI